MEDLGRPRSAGDILRSAVRAYRSHFRVMFAVYLLPLLPFLLLYGAFASNHPFDGSGLLSAALLMVAGVFAMIPFTVVLSDIWLGNPPSVRRAYRRAFEGTAGKVLGTLLLQIVVISLGCLLVIPGLVMSVFFMFSLTAVVLERTSGIAALRRSRELGKGFYLRNFGVWFLMLFLVEIAAFAIGAICAVAALTAGIPLAVGSMIALVLALPVYPLPIIVMILLYYDMRVRKEAYDNAALAEDLRR